MVDDVVELPADHGLDHHPVQTIKLSAISGAQRLLPTFDACHARRIGSVRDDHKPADQKEAFEILQTAGPSGWVWPIPETGRMGIALPDEVLRVAVFTRVESIGLRSVHLRVEALKRAVEEVDDTFLVRHHDPSEPRAGLWIEIEIGARKRRSGGETFNQHLKRDVGAADEIKTAP